MTDAEKLKQIKTVIEAGCNEDCDDCTYYLIYGSACIKVRALDKIARIVGADV